MSGAAAKSLQSCPTLCGQVCHSKAGKENVRVCFRMLLEIQTFKLIFNYLLLPNSPALSFITPPLPPHYPILWCWEIAFNFSNVVFSHTF